MNEVIPTPKGAKYQSGFIKISQTERTTLRGMFTGCIDSQGRYEYYLEGHLKNLFYSTEAELDKILLEYNPD